MPNSRTCGCKWSPKQKVYIPCSVQSLTSAGNSYTGMKPAIHLHSRHKALKYFLETKLLAWKGYCSIQSKS